MFLIRITYLAENGYKATQYPWVGRQNSQQRHSERGKGGVGEVVSESNSNEGLHKLFYRPN